MDDTLRLDAYLDDIILVATYVSASLSFIGSLFIISVICCSVQLRYSPTIRVIAWLSVADCFAAASHFIPNHDDRLCIVQGFMQQVFFLSSFLWMAYIALNQYMGVIGRRVTEKYEVLAHLICWLIPISIGLLLLYQEKLGRTDLWCWISREYFFLKSFIILSSNFH